MYVHGKLSAKDVAPVKDLLEALVAGELSSGPAKATPVAPTLPREIAQATRQFLEAVRWPGDAERTRVVRETLEQWRDRGEPIPFEDFDRFFHWAVPADARKSKQAMAAIRAMGIDIDGLHPAIGGAYSRRPGDQAALTHQRRERPG